MKFDKEGEQFKTAEEAKASAIKQITEEINKGPHYLFITTEHVITPFDGLDESFFDELAEVFVKHGLWGKATVQ